MENVISEIVAFAMERNRTVIRICGHGASGKSTFAKELQEAFPAEMVQLLETDAYIVSNPTSQRILLQDEEGQTGTLAACHPARHDVESLRRDLNASQRDGCLDH